MARHIARVAAREFAARGYDATSVRTIVEAAGVTKPTLYYHFGSKEGLAQALLTDPLTRLVERLRADASAEAEPGAILAACFETHFTFCREDPDRARFLYALLFGPLGSSLAAEVSRFGDELVGVMVETLRPLVTTGRVAADRLDDMVMACRGMIIVATMDFLYGNKELGPGLAQRLVADLLQGFAHRSEPDSSFEGNR
ncbi:MAG: TetR/AcrR family transcriptional regulator [Isosphaeraceae bacterium]